MERGVVPQPGEMVIITGQDDFTVTCSLRTSR
jgi:hypothetical protein